MFAQLKILPINNVYTCKGDEKDVCTANDS